MMNQPNIKIVLLVLVLVVTSVILVTVERIPKLHKNGKVAYASSKTKDYKWEYIKDRLFSGKGEAEFVYKINQYNDDAPILISLTSATKQDSLAINEIIEKLRVIIPNKTIDYFKSFTSIEYKDLDTKDRYKKIKGVSHFDLQYCTIHLSFGKGNNASLFEDVLKTVLADGSDIERTNPLRKDSYLRPPSKVWFHLKESLSYKKRKQYIQYEILRTFCFIYPNNSSSRRKITNKGVFFSPIYTPHLAELNDNDKFLLQKLYEDDFLKQFKIYLNTSYPWVYAINFLNTSLAKTLAWAIIICIGLFALILLFSFLQNRKFKYAYLNYFVPIFFIWTYFMNSISIYVFITTLSKSATPLQILIFFLTASVFALIISTIMFFVETKWIDKVVSFSYQLIMKVVFTFFVFNLPIAIIFFMKGTSVGFIKFYLPTFIFTIIISIGRGFLIYLNHISQSLVKQKDVELSRLKELHAQAETKLLQSQINPHFLYNSLNSIASLAPIDSAKTQKMAHSLSDLFKYSINRKGKKMSTVKDEIEMVKSYLDIEKIRFGDRLQFDIEVDNAIENYEIPLFLIQPLVENAVKHGISQNEGNGKIVLKIEKHDNELLISVSDNGPDFPEGLVSGHGLQTVFDLLRLSYGDNASLNWTNTPEKTITITIPEIV